VRAGAEDARGPVIARRPKGAVAIQCIHRRQLGRNGARS
jgi:hypothetical protein